MLVPLFALAAAAAEPRVVHVDLEVPAASAQGWSVHYRSTGVERGRVPPVVTEVNGVSISCALDGRWLDIALQGSSGRVPEEVECFVGDNHVLMRLSQAEGAAPPPPPVPLPPPIAADGTVRIEYGGGTAEVQTTLPDPSIGGGAGEMLLDGAPWPHASCKVKGNHLKVTLEPGTPLGAGVCRFADGEVPVSVVERPG